MLLGPEMGIVKQCSLNLNWINNSTAIFSAINSLPNVLDSKVFCFLESQVMEVLFRDIRIPVCDLQLARSLS